MSADDSANKAAPEDTPVPRGPYPIAATVAGILLLSCLIGTGLYVATFSRVPNATPVPYAFGVAATLVIMLPPLWICRNKFNVSWGGLVPTLLRFGGFIPALALVKLFEGPERNYYILTLLTCYFVSLPLESRALIRMVKDQTAKPS